MADVLWEATRAPEDFKRPPTNRPLRMLAFENGSITAIVEGEFDGYVYLAWPDYEDYEPVITWTRYPARLISDPVGIAPDYADSAE